MTVGGFFFLTAVLTGFLSFFALATRATISSLFSMPRQPAMPLRRARSASAFLDRPWYFSFLRHPSLGTRPAPPAISACQHPCRWNRTRTSESGRVCRDSGFEGESRSEVGRKLAGRFGFRQPTAKQKGQRSTRRLPVFRPKTATSGDTVTF